MSYGMLNAVPRVQKRLSGEEHVEPRTVAHEDIVDQVKQAGDERGA